MPVAYDASEYRTVPVPPVLDTAVELSARP